MCDWHWEPDTAIDTPLAMMIMVNRHERRAVGGKGFGWAQLDWLEGINNNGRH